MAVKLARLEWHGCYDPVGGLAPDEDRGSGLLLG